VRLQIESVPARVDINDTMEHLESDWDSSLAKAFHYCLLRAGCEGDAETVDAIIKTAVDRTRYVTWSAFEDAEDEGEYPTPQILPEGRNLVHERYTAGEWRQIPSSVAAYKRKKMKDRRF
jgi:hypothetical protein